ncbi:MAG: hypothetical protein UZ07_CHB004003148 [Chlorobi bacterium OLB7]|nr:MAG: hypothetical protein UZ07_CHB004003148 [Chlorobi bacterium OLB7]
MLAGELRNPAELTCADQRAGCGVVQRKKLGLRNRPLPTGKQQPKQQSQPDPHGLLLLGERINDVDDGVGNQQNARGDADDCSGNFQRRSRWGVAVARDVDAGRRR